MLDQEITADLNIFTRKIMENEGISQYVINIESQTEKGVNFVSEIIFFTMISKTDERKFNLVMKTSRISEAKRKAADLSYFLYASCDEATISTKFDHLLHIYYESVAATLRPIGLNPDAIFTYQTLKEHWRKYAITGLIMASTLIKIQLMKKDEVPDLSNGEKGTDCVALKVSDMENNDIYRRRIIAVYKNNAETCLNLETEDH